MLADIFTVEVESTSCAGIYPAGGTIAIVLDRITEPEHLHAEMVVSTFIEQLESQDKLAKLLLVQARTSSQISRVCPPAHEYAWLYSLWDI